MTLSYRALALETFRDNRGSGGKIAYTSWLLAAAGSVGFLLCVWEESVRMLQVAG